MNKFFLFSLVLAFKICNGQLPNIKISQFNSTQSKPVTITKDFNNILSANSTSMPIHWISYWKNQNDYEKPLTPDAEIMNIEEKVQSNKLTTVDNYYAPYAEKIIENISDYGSQKATYFPQETAFIVCKYNIDNKGLLLITGASSGSVFNTLKLTTKQRAARTLQENILPAVRLLALDNLKITGINYLGICFTYGSKDFLKDEDASDLKPEYLCVVFPIELLSGFINNNVSADDLILKSGIFLKDRDALTANKISLTLD